MTTDICKRIVDQNTPLEEALDLCDKALKNELFTAMRFHAATMEVERLHSTLPDSYPVSGRKPKRDTEWGKKVLIDREINLGFGAADIRWAFSDHETILGLGLNAVLNVPIVLDGSVLGTINYLRGDPAFSSREVGIAEQVAAALANRSDLRD
ncbi:MULTISPECIES: GAF domain-containing protein [unclassified Sulfitobacter]|uniref:GAF domain-containing protein n=1 Tax=unclassified Sulfitobacter TaxID=196795 RepID=UPI00374752DC